MPAQVPLAGRVLDVVGVAIFLVGAGCYAWAYVGLRRLQDGFEPAPDEPAFAAMARFHDLSELSRVGVGLMVVGVLVAVTAAVVARRLAR